LEAELRIQHVDDYFDQFQLLLQGTAENRSPEQTFNVPEHIGSGSITRMRIRSGMEIVITDVMLKEDMRLRIRGDYRLFELNYCASGETCCSWNGKNRITGERAGNICILDDVEVYMEKKAGVRNRQLEIRLAPDRLLRYAEGEQERAMMESLVQRRQDRIEPYAVTPSIANCVRELMSCSYKGSMKRLYMESKALEMISLYCEANQAVAPSKSGLRKHDKIRLEEAKRTVLSNLEQPFTIRELARMTGLNEFKLKQGFRELFGMSIFELVRFGRMEKAIALLEEGRLNIGQTAAAVGYSNASNFTAAFRKQYGCNPSEYVDGLRH